MNPYILVPTVFITATILGLIILLLKDHKNKKKMEIVEGSNDDYFRDIPCMWSVDLCYYTALFFDRNIVELQMNYISSKAFQFYRDKKIGIQKDEDGNYYLDLTKIPKLNNEVDKYVYNILLAASSSNNLLTQHELSYYLDINYASVMHSLDKIQDILEKEFNEKKLNLKEEYLHICGLKRFIRDFSIIPELDHDHVYLRDEYLTFAVLFDLTEKIESDFNLIYPFIYNNPLLDPDNAKKVYGNNMYEDLLLSRYPWLKSQPDDIVDKIASKFF